MMTINLNTKIDAIIKLHPDALEAIVSINPKFEKLRNPILRKLMAGRASIAMASKIAGCDANKFFEKLKPLGFEIDSLTIPESIEKKETPDFITNLNHEEVVNLDIRLWEETLQKYHDKLETIDVRQLEMPLPMLTILNALENLQGDSALFVYHKRIPVFLLPELAERKYEYRIREISDGEVQMLIFKA